MSSQESTLHIELVTEVKTKTCTRCKAIKEITQFYKVKNSCMNNVYYRSICKVCDNDRCKKLKNAKRPPNIQPLVKNAVSLEYKVQPEVRALIDKLMQDERSNAFIIAKSRVQFGELNEITTPALYRYRSKFYPQTIKRRGVQPPTAPPTA